jgi:hypothetical protein
MKTLKLDKNIKQRIKSQKVTITKIKEKIKHFFVLKKKPFSTSNSNAFSTPAMLIHE